MTTSCRSRTPVQTGSQMYKSRNKTIWRRSLASPLSSPLTTFLISPRDISNMRFSPVSSAPSFPFSESSTKIEVVSAALAAAIKGRRADPDPDPDLEWRHGFGMEGLGSILVRRETRQVPRDIRSADLSGLRHGDAASIRRGRRRRASARLMASTTMRRLGGAIRRSIVGGSSFSEAFLK